MKNALVLALAAALASACAGRIDPPPAQTPPSPPPPPAVTLVAVEGRVINGNGQPAAGVQVALVGRAPALTCADGRFRFTDVPAPYRVELFAPSAALTAVYLGLSRPDPTLYLPELVGEQQRAPVALAGPAPASLPFPQLDDGPVLGFHGPSGALAVSLHDQVAWEEPAREVSGRLSVVQLQRVLSDGVEPATQALVAAGHAEVAAAAGQPAFAQVLLAPVAPLTVTGAVTCEPSCLVEPPLVVLPSWRADVQLGRSYQTDSFSIPLGWTAEVPLAVRVSATGGNTWNRRSAVRRISPDRPSHDVELPDFGKAALNEGMIGAGAPFSWLPPERSVVRFKVSFPADPSAGLGSRPARALVVVTQGSSLRLYDPDLGPPLPVGAPGALVLEAWGPLGSVDEFADPQGYGAMRTGERDSFTATTWEHWVELQ